MFETYAQCAHNGGRQMLSRCRCACRVAIVLSAVCVCRIVPELNFSTGPVGLLDSFASRPSVCSAVGLPVVCVFIAAAAIIAQVVRWKGGRVRPSGISLERRFQTFDVAVDRSAVHTVKYGLHGSSVADAIPLWVADIDLPCCPKIQKALSLRVVHPTFGYTFQPKEIWYRVAAWLRENQGWPESHPELESFVFCPCVVTAFVCALRAFTSIGDGVLVMTPLYSPLQRAVEGEGRRLVRHRLVEQVRPPSTGIARVGRDANAPESAEYAIDWPKFEAQMVSESVRLVLLCSPHNPSGRIWSRCELERLAAICQAQGALVVSDEIHADWCLWGNGFVPFAAVAGSSCVTLGAPTKTWGLAGLHCSFLVIEDVALRKKYMGVVEHAFLHYGGVFASEAMLAAYVHGGPWLQAAKEYVQGSILEVEAYLATHVPEIRPWHPEATFLIWLDFSRLGLTAFGLRELLDGAGVVLSPGNEFAEETIHFQRMNVAHARPVLREALARLRAAVEEHRTERALLSP